MVELTPKDSSILTRIARYGRIPKSERKQLLQQASDKAKEIGNVILGVSSFDSADEDTKQAAKAYQDSVRRVVAKKARVGKRK